MARTFTGPLLLAGLILGSSVDGAGPSAATAADPWPLGAGGPRRLSLDDGWRFHMGEAPGAEQPSFDDTTWRVLDLPHDWAIEGPFDQKHGPSQGALPFYGTGWYRKHFSLPTDAAGRHVAIELDGAMSNSRVWLDGVELGDVPAATSASPSTSRPTSARGGRTTCSPSDSTRTRSRRAGTPGPGSIATCGWT